jgi:hypothetical protein
MGAFATITYDKSPLSQVIPPNQPKGVDTFSTNNCVSEYHVIATRKLEDAP